MIGYFINVFIAKVIAFKNLCCDGKNPLAVDLDELL